MRKFLFLFFALFISVTLFAQLEVKPGSFKEVVGFVNINSDPNYQTDDNELPFAVIKVRTENINDKQRRELRFSGNAGTFIVLEYKDGEVWVYLTAKYAEYLKISHPDFSSMEFAFPFDLEPKKGYEMTLVNNEKIETGVGLLTIRTKPDGAIIALNGININQHTPYVNDMMAAGTYSITVSKNKYRSETRTVKLENGAKETVDIELVYDIADITVKVDNDAEVYIDGVMHRKGTWVGELESGTHTIECRKLYHKPVVKTITVVANRPQTYTLAPTPIYGNIEINTEPKGANVFIDNRNYGTTPLVLNQVIIGTHEMAIEKNGYKPLEKTIFLEEHNNLVINEKLPVGVANRTFTVNGVSFEMVAVEGGTFMMGAQKSNFKGVNYDAEADVNEFPVHEVTLSDYYIGKYEVTQGLWSAVMGTNPPDLKGDDYPADQITWFMAIDFCNKLSEACGRTPYYYYEEVEINTDSNAGKGSKKKSKQTEEVKKEKVLKINPQSNGFRLPTEAEWEFAAKGGNKSKGYKYSGSNTLSDVAWFFRNSGDKYLTDKFKREDGKYKRRLHKRDEHYYYGLTDEESYGNKCRIHPVGNKRPNEIGIYDMSGNVCEWCYDWEGTYKTENEINPLGLEQGDQRIIRGGGWFDYEEDCRVTSKSGNLPSQKYEFSYYYTLEFSGDRKYWKNANGVGFRLVVNQ